MACWFSTADGGYPYKLSLESADVSDEAFPHRYLKAADRRQGPRPNRLMDITKRLPEVIYTPVCIKAKAVGNLDMKPLPPKRTANFTMHSETTSVDIARST